MHFSIWTWLEFTTRIEGKYIDFKKASFVEFTDAYVVRHPLVAGVVRAYAKRESKLNMNLKDD